MYIAISATLLLILVVWLLKREYVKRKTAQKMKELFPKTLLPDKCIGYKFPPKKARISTNDAITYHLSIGFSQDPTDDNDLKFTYEGHPEFQLFPMIGTAFPWCQVYKRFMFCPGIPMFKPQLMLHAENRTEFCAPIELNKEIEAVMEIGAVSDKGERTGALITLLVNSY